MKYYQATAQQYSVKKKENTYLTYNRCLMVDFEIDIYLRYKTDLTNF